MLQLARFLRLGLLSTVLVGLILMSLSLKVRHFEGNDQLIAFEDFEIEYINDHWLDWLLIEIAETGEDLPGKHLQIFKKAKHNQQVKATLPVLFANTFFLTQDASHPRDVVSSPQSHFNHLPPPSPFVPLYLLTLF